MERLCLMEVFMELIGRIFLLAYESEMQGGILGERTKFIIFKEKDTNLLWYENPLKLNDDGTFKIESISIAAIRRMEEKQLSDLEKYIEDRNLIYCEKNILILKRRQELRALRRSDNAQ